MYIYFQDSDSESLDAILSLSPRLAALDCTPVINLPPVELLASLPPRHASLVFLDTRYNGAGFALAESIRKTAPLCHIVFLSAYAEDMSFCFRNLLRPSGFLLKPVSCDEIFSIIRAVLRQDAGEEEGRAEKICLSAQDFKRTIDVSEILYFSTRGKKLICRTTDGETVSFYGTLKALEKRYAGNFIRCHSGFLANRDLVLEMKKGELYLKKCSEALPVSKKYRPHIAAFLQNEGQKR